VLLSGGSFRANKWPGLIVVFVTLRFWIAAADSWKRMYEKESEERQPME
jgi:hypothetical protein